MRRQHVADVMTTDVVTVDADAGFKEIVTLMSGYGVSALPVVDRAGHVLGMVTESDLLRKIEYSQRSDFVPLFQRLGHREARRKAAAVAAAWLMSAPAVTIGPAATLVAAARVMSRRELRRLPVTDEFAVLVGIVSRRDLVSVFARPDAEITADVREQVLRRAMSIAPDSMQVHVTAGVVDVAGQLERRALVPLLIEFIRTVDGVVDVKDHLTYRTDDIAPSPYVA